MVGARDQSAAQLLDRAVEVQEPYVSRAFAEHVTVAPPQGRAGDDRAAGMGIDPLQDQLQPGPSVLIVKGHAGGHLRHVLGRMEIIGLRERPARAGQRASGRLWSSPSQRRPSPRRLSCAAHPTRSSSVGARRGGMAAVGFARGSRAGSQPVEHLSGVRLHEGVGISFELADVNRLWIEVVQVHGAHEVLGDASSQGHDHPVALTPLGVPGALPAEVGGVREITPGNITEAVPLTEEVVAVVIADLGNLRVHDRDLGDVRGVDDHFAAVGDDRLQ